MPPIPRDRQDWLPELDTALRAIADAFAGHDPTPELAVDLAPRFLDVVPGHQVELHWLENGYLYEPELDDPGAPEYAITITGDRLTAGWLVPAAELAGLLRSVC